MKLGRITRRSALVPLAFAAMLAFTYGGALAAPQATTVTGAWRGDSNLNGHHGLALMKLAQHGSTIRGAFGGGTVTGAITGQNMVPHIRQNDGSTRITYVMTVTVDATFDTFSGTMDITIQQGKTTQHVSGTETGIRIT